MSHIRDEWDPFDRMVSDPKRHFKKNADWDEVDWDVMTPS